VKLDTTAVPANSNTSIPPNTSLAPLASTQQQQLTKEQQWPIIKHRISLVFLVACPTLILLPPRKLDFYTFALTGATVISANHLVKERYGRGIIGVLASPLTTYRFKDKDGTSWRQDLPTEEARIMRERLRSEKEARDEGARRLERDRRRVTWATDLAVGQEEHDREAEDEQRKLGMLDRLWMGRETEGWKERRAKKEQEVIDRGEGYGTLIVDYLRGAAGWDQKGEAEKNNEEKNPRLP
jgi:hypothetical protein